MLHMSVFYLEPKASKGMNSLKGRNKCILIIPGRIRLSLRFRSIMVFLTRKYFIMIAGPLEFVMLLEDNFNRFTLLTIFI